MELRESDFKLNYVPTYLVADLECVLTKLDDEKKGAHTRYIHKHQPCAFVIVVVTVYKKVAFIRAYTCSFICSERCIHNGKEHLNEVSHR